MLVFRLLKDYTFGPCSDILLFLLEWRQSRVMLYCASRWNDFYRIDSFSAQKLMTYILTDGKLTITFLLICCQDFD